MPVGGTLKLKSGETLTQAQGVKKKKSKQKKNEIPEGEEDRAPEGQQGEGEAGPSQTQRQPPVNPAAVNLMSGKTYEEDFVYETERMKTGKVRTTAWGATYRKPMEIPHGYTHKITGKTAEERLDLRSTTKADKFCK